MAKQSSSAKESELVHDSLSNVRLLSLRMLALILFSSAFLLFLGMSLRPLVYDEGLILTAAMRVAAGQIPHRDFYANYGPAQFYFLAALFKVFGPSVFVERIYDLLIKGLLISAVCAIARSYASKWVAACTATAMLLWLFCLSELTATPVIPVSLLNLVSSALLLKLFQGHVSTRRLLVVGGLAGAAALFRYDTGIALFCVQTFAIGMALYLTNSLRLLTRTWGAYALGFALVTAPPLLYYLSLAPLYPVIHDILLYPSKYYHRGRNLPFPSLGMHTVENIQVYLVIITVVITCYAAAVQWPRIRRNFAEMNQGEKQFYALLITFSPLALAMFLKGFVRMTIPQMYLCIVPSLLLLAGLFQYRRKMSIALRAAILSVAMLSGLAVVSATIHQIKGRYLYHVSVLERWATSGKNLSSDSRAWCKLKNPLTVGLCFLPEEDQVQTIEFLNTHTGNGQTLYVGLLRHDIIFANNNLIYFATQRLPATHWSHFDPGLQNRLDIQKEMVGELERNNPPYIVLDTEFDYAHEPNDSSRSSGVTILDEWIRQTYQHEKTFGQLSVWQRVN